MRRGAAAALVGVALCALGGCGSESSSGTEVLSVYVSLPLHGERAAEGAAIEDGAKLALSEAGGRAGGVRVRAVYLDDTGGGRRWDPVATAANARRAAEDTSSIAFIGDLDDGATRTSLPITNQAEIPQISPGSTAVDLTRHVSPELDPALYRPSGEQSFARLVPNAGVIAKQVDSKCGGGGTAPPAVSPFQSVSGLGPDAAAFLKAYRATYGEPDPASAYGYEAMSLVLAAVDGEGKGASRGSVRDDVLGTRDRESVIGKYSIESTGDTTLRAFGPLPGSICGPGSKFVSP